MILQRLNQIISKKHNDRELDFLVIGTQKGGTSALDIFLRQHPEVGMANKKELHFFDNENIFSKKKIINYKKLHKHFNFSNNKKVYGEITPSYMYWEQSIQRIWNYNKKIKLIVILRNPISRAFSHWNMEVDRKKETDDFEYCIRNESIKASENLPFQHKVYSYVDRGFYSKQIIRIFQYFKKTQILFIKYEDFKYSPQSTLLKVFDFLNINNQIKIQLTEVHKRKYQRKISEVEKNILYEIYKKDIIKTEKLLNWDCSDWKDF
jgi:hypothetical protein